MVTSITSVKMQQPNVGTKMLDAGMSVVHCFVVVLWLFTASTGRVLSRGSINDLGEK